MHEYEARFSEYVEDFNCELRTIKIYALIHDFNRGQALKSDYPLFFMQ